MFCLDMPLVCEALSPDSNGQDHPIQTPQSHRSLCCKCLFNLHEQEQGRRNEGRVLNGALHLDNSGAEMVKRSFRVKPSNFGTVFQLSGS